MEVINKIFNVQGLESSLLSGITKKHTLCYRLYSNIVPMPVKGFACIFTDISGENVVDMGIKSLLQVNSVNMHTYEHTPVFKTPMNITLFTLVNHFVHDVVEEDGVWIHTFPEIIRCPLEFEFHLEIPECVLVQHNKLRIRLKLF